MNTLNFFVTADYPTGDPLDNKCGPLNNVECRGWDSDQPDEFTRQRDKLLAGARRARRRRHRPQRAREHDRRRAARPSIVVAGSTHARPPTLHRHRHDRHRCDQGRAHLPAATSSRRSATSRSSTRPSTRASSTRKSRPSLAQTFEVNATGARFTVVVNHLKSKGSDCDDVGDPDLGDGQGNCSQTRTAAAEALVDWLATDPTGSGDPDFLIIGDLNSYAQEDPIDAIKAGADDIAGTADDYTNLIATYQGAFAYSYIVRRPGRLPRPRAGQRDASSARSPAPPTGTSTPTSPTSSTTTPPSSRRPRTRSTSRTPTAPRTTTRSSSGLPRTRRRRSTRAGRTA